MVSEDKLAPQAQATGGDLNQQLAGLRASEAYKRGDAAAAAKVHQITLELTKLEQARG
jgi:hypothetical protein